MTFEDKMQQSGEQLLQRIHRQTEQEVHGFVSELLTAAAKELAAALEDDRRVAGSDEVLGRVLDGVRRLDQASRLTDALDTLADLAGNEASRAAVLTVQDDRVRGWRFVGFGPTLDEARQVDLQFGDAGIVGHAVVTGEVSSAVSGPNGVPWDAEPAFTTLPLGVHALGGAGAGGRAGDGRRLRGRRRPASRDGLARHA